MTGTLLQVGVAEEMQALLDKVRTGNVGIVTKLKKCIKKVSVCFRSTANGMCAAEDSSPGIGSDMQVLMTRYSCWVSRLRHKVNTSCALPANASFDHLLQRNGERKWGGCYLHRLCS